MNWGDGESSARGLGGTANVELRARWHGDDWLDQPHCRSLQLHYVPGGGALAGLYTASGTTTTWVPLLDQDGSTLGLVNAANPDSGPVTNYAYDPSGNPTWSGAANDWPFQYQGMEKEYTDPGTYYYSGGGQFYSPQLVRSLSETSATSTQGSGGAPPKQLAYGPGSERNGSFGHWYVKQLEGTSGFGGDYGGGGDDSDAVPILPIIGDLEFWASFFDWLLSGSSAPPTPRKLLHGRHPLYPVFIGTPIGLIPTQGPSGAPQLCGDQSVCNVRPLRVKDPAPGPTPTQESPQKSQACQQAQVELKQCFAVFEVPSDIPESIAIYACEVDPEEVSRLAFCSGAIVMEIPKKIGEGKCLYDYYQACK